MDNAASDFQAQLTALDAEYAQRRKALASSALISIEARQVELRDARLRIHHEICDLNTVAAKIRESSDTSLPLHPDRPGLVKRAALTVHAAVLSVLDSTEFMTSKEVVEAVRQRYPDKWKCSAIQNALFQGLVPTNYVEAKLNDRPGACSRSKLYRLARDVA